MMSILNILNSQNCKLQKSQNNKIIEFVSFITKDWLYSQARVKRPPSGPQISGRCWQVVAVKR